MELKQYYHNEFEKDINKLRFEPMRLRDGVNYISFTMKTILDVLKGMDTKRRVNFLYSLFITTASDQIMFAYFRNHHRNFANIVNYPKFQCTNCGLCIRNGNPFYLLAKPLNENLISSNDIMSTMDELVELFRYEVDDFLTKYKIDIDVNLFFNKFANDGETKYIISQNSEQYPFLNDILKKLSNI